LAFDEYTSAYSLALDFIALVLFLCRFALLDIDKLYFYDEQTTAKKWFGAREGNSWEKLIALEVEGSDEIPCRTLILSLGVFPEITLAKETGLKIRRGVLVDEYLRTSDEHIYALGDCAEYEGQIPGIVPVALAMAETVIANLTGKDKSYEEPVFFTRFKDDGLQVISVGDVSGVALSRESPGRYEAYFLKEGSLVGAILYGSVDHLKFVRSNYKRPVNEEDISALLDF